MNELDQHITDYNKRRRREKKGRTVGLVLRAGEHIIGELIKHEPNKLYVKDWLDYDIEKEIHRAVISSFVILLDGGLSEEK